MKQKLQNKIIQFGLISYWFLFWTLNTIDKFIGESTFLWVGKDRVEQFTGYFSSVGITDPSWAVAAITLVTILELVAAVMLFGALVLFLQKKYSRADALFFWGTFIGLVIFSLFSIGDQVFGERFELLEHSMYWMALIVSWGAYEFFPRMKKMK